MSSFAIGAETLPPKPFGLALDDDRAGEHRVLGRGEEDEPRVVDARRAGLGGAGLAGDA